jgi:hypothetical protein
MGGKGGVNSLTKIVIKSSIYIVMTREEFLASNFNELDIKVEQYWSLSEEDKKYITEKIVEYIEIELHKNLNLFNYYEYILMRSEYESSLSEEYERADILKRTSELLKEKYLKYF